MSLIESTLVFETKILDIGYLLMLKQMKESSFTLDRKFMMLYTDVMKKQKRFKEALDFIEEAVQHFDADRNKRQIIEQDLLYMQGKSILTINYYFIMLRFNSNVHNYRELFPTYKKCIRFLLTSYLPSNDYDMAALKEVPEFVTADDAYKVEATSAHHGANFEQVAVEDVAETVLVICLYSLKNLRKNTA